MRTMLRAKIPVEAGNDGIKDGSLAATLESVMARLKPEAAYFVTEDGQRCALMFFDMADPTDIPSIAEPFFMNLNASVDFQPAMNQEDLQAGLGKMA